MAEAADFPGMSPSPARRWLRRTGALLAGAPLLAGLFQLPAAQAAVPASPKAASDAGTVAVAVDSLSPGVPTDGDTLTVSGTVTNNGKQAVTDAHVGLRVGSALTTRSAIDDAAKRPDNLSGGYGSEVGGTYVTEFGLDGARELARECHAAARSALAEANSPHPVELEQITDFILTRTA